jgi:hypothetical protein
MIGCAVCFKALQSTISNQHSAFDEIQIVGPPNQWYGFDALMMRLELPDCVNSVAALAAVLMLRNSHTTVRT